MPLTPTVQWPTFPAGVPVTNARLRRAPAIVFSGSIATGDLASGAVTDAKVTPDAYWYGVSTYAANVYTLTLSPALAALADGVVVAFRAGNDNGDTSPSLNVNGLGSKPLYKQHQQTLRAGDIRNGQIVVCRYDGTALAWQIISANGQPEARWTTAAGTANALTLDFGGVTTYPTFKTATALAHRIIWFQVGTTNTGPATLNVDGLGALSIVKGIATPLVANDLRAGEQHAVMLIGSTFFLLTPRLQAATGAWAKFNGTSTDKTISNTLPGSNNQTVTTHAITAATTLANVTAATVRTSGVLPTGLAANTVYYIFVVDANTVRFATSRQGGLDGTSDIVTISGAGSGTNTLNYVTVNASYNVTAVTHTSSGASLLTGDFLITFAVAFGSAHYAVSGSVKVTGGNNGVVVVDTSDAGAAGSKRIQCVDLGGTAQAYDEIYLTAHGLPV